MVNVYTYHFILLMILVQVKLLNLTKFHCALTGPAFYNILNYRIATPHFKNVLAETRKKGAFGSTVPRLLYLVNREAFVTPGPADYQVTFFCPPVFAVICSKLEQGNSLHEESIDQLRFNYDTKVLHLKSLYL